MGRDGSEDAARGLGGYVDYEAFYGIIEGGHQQALGFGFGELVVVVGPDVEEAARGEGHQQASVFGAADAGADDVVERERGIKRHVRFVLMLAQPSGQVLIVVVAVLVEDHDYGADFAGQTVGLADVDFFLMPVADGFAEVDAVEQGSGEGLDADSLFGEQRLWLFS